VVKFAILPSFLEKDNEICILLSASAKNEIFGGFVSVSAKKVKFLAASFSASAKKVKFLAA
jgi:hypothetical protein